MDRNRKAQMALKVYMAIRDITSSDLARDLGYAHVYVSRIVRGRVEPGRKFIRALKEYTKGEVDLSDPDVKTADKQAVRRLLEVAKKEGLIDESVQLKEKEEEGDKKSH